MRYQVKHRYSSSTYGPWAEGDFVELDPDQAAWVNHDSEGTLSEVDPQQQAAEKRAAQEKTEARRRSAAAAKASTEEAPAPKRGPGRPRKTEG